MSRKVKEFYERRVEFESGKRGKRYVRGENKKLKTLLRMLRNESCKVVLELGCGRGSYLKSISELLNAEPVGIDISKNVLKSSHGFSRILCDIEVGIPFKDETFDLVLLLDVIEHLFDTDRLLFEVKRVLKPGGIVVITTPNLASWYNRLFLLIGWQPFWTEVSTKFVIGNPLRERRAKCGGIMPSGHLRLFTPLALRRFVEMCGFSVEEVRGYPPNENFGILFSILEGMSRITPNLASFIALKARKIL